MKRRVAGDLVGRGLAASLGCFGLGCGAGPAPDPVAESAAAIVDGVLDDSTTGVVFVMPAVCSGTLIAPNLVLTAQHCVAPVDDDPDVELVGCYPSVLQPALPAGYLDVHTGSPTGADPSRRHGVLEVRLPIPSTPANQICGNDMALLVLDAPVPIGEAAPLVPRVDVPLAAGELFSAVGYGRLEEETPVDEKAATRYRRDDLLVECVGDACSSLPGYVVSSEWRGDGATCAGDSGGPAVDAAGRVVGVDSRNNGCGSYSLFGAIDAHGEWIRATALEAAEIGGYAAPTWSGGWPTDPAYSYPIGDPCQAGTDCPSGHCIEEACTRSCNAAAPCPEELECDASTSLCTPPPSDPVSKPPAPSDEAPREASSCTLGTGGGVAPSGSAIAVAASALLGLFLGRRSRRHPGPLQRASTVAGAQVPPASHTSDLHSIAGSDASTGVHAAPEPPRGAHAPVVPSNAHQRPTV